jgi:putative redox protein
MSEVLPHEGLVVVRPTKAGRFQQLVTAGDHEFVVDEPAGVGGRDAGPTPYDLILGALGACTSMTLRLYAERKGLPLDDAEVTLSHRRIHAKDCADCESPKAMIDEITVRIALKGPLNDEQRTRLLEIAEMCPVHRTLAGEIKIRTSLVPPA